MFSEDQNKTLIPLNSWRALKHSPVCAILRNFHLDYPRNAIVINWIFHSILLRAWRETKNLAKQVQKTCNKPFEMHKKCMQHQPVMRPNCNTPAGAASDWSLTVHDASDLPGRRNALDFCFVFVFVFCFAYFIFLIYAPKIRTQICLANQCDALPIFALTGAAGYVGRRGERHREYRTRRLNRSFATESKTN